MDTLKPRALSLEIEPTNLCNTQCVHCPHDTISRPIGKMDWETYQTLVDKTVAISDYLYIGFAGMGEPLLNPLIYPFVEYAHTKAITMITSNASALTAQNMEKLITAGLKILIISFNGYDKASYELMMGGLNFERAQKNLDAAIHLSQGTSTEILINLSVTRQSEGHIEEIRKYFFDRGIQNIIFSKCHNRGGFLKGNLICRTPLPPGHQTRCDIFSNTLFVAWNGDVLSCCHDLAGENRLGNLKTDPIEGILSKKEEILKQGMFFEICKQCNDFYRFSDDQKTSGISISQSVYDLYTGRLSSKDGILADTAISEWLLATYFQEGKLHELLKAINNSNEGEMAALRLENQKLGNQLEEIPALHLENEKLHNQLNEITQHRLWRIFQSLQKTRLFLIPKGSRREIIFKKIWGSKTTPQESFGLASEPNDLQTVIQHHLSGMDPASFFFIEIGAYDGISNDPIYPLVQQHHWRGILIEPQPDIFKNLTRNYRDEPQLEFVNAVISDRDGEQNFFRVRQDDPGLPEWSRQIASLSREHILKHQEGMPDFGITDKIPDIADSIICEKVNSISFKTLVERYHVAKLDLLHIDAEGYDDEIIKMIDFKRLQPGIIQYEHMHLSPERRSACEELLKKQGYRIINGFADVIAYL